MPRFEKDVMIKELKACFDKSPYVFFSSIGGLSVSEVTQLRQALQPKSSRALVVKHTFAKRVLKEKGLADALEPIFKDSMLLTFGDKDPQDISKLLVDFLKGHEKFVLRGAIFEGKVIETSLVKEMAKLPSRQVLLGKVVSGMNAPIAGLVLTLGSLVRSFVVVLNQIAEKKK
jgi:large subunit ribosomal protein L10